MSIRTKIMLAIILAVLLSILGVTAMVSHEMNKAFIDNFKVNAKAQVDRMDVFVDNFFKNALASARLLSTEPALLDHLSSLTSYKDNPNAVTPVETQFSAEERLVYDVMERLHSAVPAYSIVYAGSAAGGFTQAPNVPISPHYNPAERPWYVDATKHNKPVVTEFYISDTGEMVCTVAAPFQNRKGERGVVGLDIDLNTLTRAISSVRVGKTGFMMMLDNLGQVVSIPAHSSDMPGAPKEAMLGKLVNDLPEAYRAAFSQLRKNDGYMEVDMEGRTRLVHVASNGYGWKLILMQDKAEVFASAMGVTLSILFVGAIIVAVMAAVALVLSRSIAGPVSRLAAAAESVAAGNLNAIPENENMFKAELSVLHVSLKRMVAKLVELVTTANVKMKEAEDALSLSRQSLAEAEKARIAGEQARREGVLQTADRIGSALSELTAAAKGLAREAEETGRRTVEQRDRVAGTVTALEEMNSAQHEVAGSTTRTAALAEDAKAQAQAGKALVLEMVTGMEEIKDKSQVMREGLGHLGKQAEDIGQILNVITDIADQTNLLALNAAIEAARAGEAGRGFAVVADEVRKLAEKTMQATKQVGDAINTVQRGTAQNIAAMSETADYIGRTTQIASRAGEALERIEGMVNNTAGEVHAIATAGEHQSASLDNISRTTEGINMLTIQVAESAERSTGAVHTLSATVQRLTDIVEALKKE